MAVGLGSLSLHRAPRSALWLRVTFIAVGVMALAGIGGGAVYACTGAIDFTGSGGPAEGLQGIQADSNLLFAVHADFARALDTGNCSPVASGVQWLKAAAHGAAPDLNQQVVDGFTRARERSTTPEATAAGICAHITPGSFRQRQLDDLRQAGLPCSDGV